MDLFDLGRTLHSTFGTLALGSFWTAALAPKGGPTHRKAGTVHLLSLIGVMALSSLMVAGKALQGDPGLAIFFAFLISIVASASCLVWFSVRDRRDPAGLTGIVYRALASWLVIAGLGLFCLGLARRLPLTMFLSLVGAGFGANMWRLARARDRGGPRWWRAQHLNGGLMSFIATHDSFLALGLGSILPALRQPVPRMLVAIGVVAVGLSLRIWLARRPGRPPGASESPAKAARKPEAMGPAVSGS